MSIRKIILAFFKTMKPIVRQNSAFFVALGAVIALSAILIKDYISEEIRSHLQSVETAKQFYSLHNEDIELEARLEDKISELSQYVMNSDGSSSSTMKTATEASLSISDATRDWKLARASNENTEELLKHVHDSQRLFFRSEGNDQLLQFDFKLLTKALSELSDDLDKSQTELNKAYNLLLIPNHKFTQVEIGNIERAFAAANETAGDAAIQAIHLKELASQDRSIALKVTATYGNLLEEENRLCKWTIFGLILVSSIVGLLSQLAGVKGEGGEAI